jgi:serine/threonine protein kinase
MVRSESLDPGAMVDHFKVVRLLGKGGFGEVFLARDTRLGRKVALKVINREHLDSEEALQRFLFEARATARFNHPHIVTVYAVGESGGVPYVALEYLEGQTLRERMREQPPALKEGIRIGLAVAQALREAHRHKILHRDLKPENILLPADGRLRVVDFGLAKRVDRVELPAPRKAPPGDAQRAELSVTLPVADPPRVQLEETLPPGESTRLPAMIELETEGDRTIETPGFDSVARRSVRGTPIYMAPEQWRAESGSEATDLWALGVILHELVSGQLPFQAKRMDELASLVCGEAAAPTLEGEEVPPALRRLVQRCLEKDPGRRPTAAAAVQTLEELLGGATEAAAGEQGPFRGLLPFTEEHAALARQPSSAGSARSGWPPRSGPGSCSSTSSRGRNGASSVTEVESSRSRSRPTVPSSARAVRTDRSGSGTLVARGPSGARRSWPARPPDSSSHRGIVDLGSGAARSPSASWERRVQDEARLADLDLARGRLCLQTHDARILLLDLRSGRTLFERGAALAVQLVVARDGCATVDADRRATIHRVEGVQVVGEDARSVTTAGDTLAVIRQERLELLGPAGRVSHPLPAGVTAARLVGRELLLGFEDGRVAGMALGADPETVPARWFESADGGAVVSLSQTAGLAVAGYATGVVAIWDLETRRRLVWFQLNGAVVHLARGPGQLYLATDLGDHRVLDLSAIELAYCDLMRRIWRELPEAWSEEGRIVGEPPEHRCRR